MARKQKQTNEEIYQESLKHPLFRGFIENEWGKCCDCGSKLWVEKGKDNSGSHCTPCHMIRLFGKR